MVGRATGSGPDAREDFLHWLGADRKMATTITGLISEIRCDPFTGIGRPEPLRVPTQTAPVTRVDRTHPAGSRHGRSRSPCRPGGVRHPRRW